MARLPRLAPPGLPQLVVLRGVDGRLVTVDDADRQHCLASLHEAAANHRLAIHAYALLPDRLRLLATPAGPSTLGRALQDFGRRYVAGFNRRHGRHGPLWDGRYRATVVQPGNRAVEAQVFVETEPVRSGLVETSGAYEWSSACAHIGFRSDPRITMLAEYWALGNTPFERETTYARMLSEGLPTPRIRQLDDACAKGWPIGDDEFLAGLAAATNRPVRPRRAGRPTKRPA